VALPVRQTHEPETLDDSSVEEPELVEEAPEEPPAKKPRPRGRPTKAATSTNKPTKPSMAKQKRPRDSEITVVSSPIQVHRGPPRPNHSRGLFTLRRETPDNVYGQTRSGRNVVKPSEWWNNEKIIYEDEEVYDNNGAYLVRTVKEVIRAEPIETEKSKRGRKKGAKVTTTKRRRAAPESEDEFEDLEEPWESEPGRVFGEVRTWNPEDQTGVESQEKEEEIALSSAAIITRDIPGASFRFAKTLTHPFFGSGMVDLPPGAAKKPKNSRKMQMVFFVYTGRVNVTVNENSFRIGKGGMWQVPRGMCAFL
jgi:centromere protein C